MHLDFSDLVDKLGTPAKLVVSSTPELAEEVEKVARERIGPKRGASFLYRKPVYSIPSNLFSGIESSPAEVLRELGLATTFVTASPFADIARHWAHVRYCATLWSNRKRTLALTQAGSDIVHHHKVAQSEQLGIGLALVVAKRILERNHPGWLFSSVDVDVALEAGFIEGVGLVRQKKKATMRPDYFLVGRHAGGGQSGCKVYVLECKGTHGNKHHSKRQLATASLQVGSIEVGSRTLPSLIVASRLSTAGVSIDVLDPPGDADLWGGASEEFDALLSDDPGPRQWTSGKPTFEQFFARQRELLGAEEFQPSEAELQAARAEYEEILGELPVIFQVPEDGKNWLFRILARNTAHSILRFAGDNTSASRFATPRTAENQRLPIDDPTPDWQMFTVSSEFNINSHRFVGVEYSMPLPNGASLKIFRGVEKGMYESLCEGRVSAYLRRAQQLRGSWASVPSGAAANGTQHQAVSVGSDGTGLRIRVV
ncbi:conserved hypothetical protein [Streptomyces viridosporus ATCC 14672]|uniref:Uncharacterized protein n=1 Tax=Streptomyces viridosporus (strain ATCC 14672 / DSM 40746 / JCM 4963 / KCTC 9882 / NRRL B-12104 / FH 1290) TaxID=566461 RepID=D6A9E6_STRV1|nr:hypothetical protein [Streptomyces viridosporus]EFE68182.1 conserved hypothetical protein [Streptomyces viridosporus ATCC 14672]